MPDSVQVEPGVLRRLAVQHEEVATAIRAWAEPPHEWLTAFPDTYGRIASAVETALYGYYDARQKAGMQLADQHDQTALALRRAADDYERVDHEGAAAINHGGDQPGTPPHSNGNAPVTGTPGGTANSAPSDHSTAQPVSAPPTVAPTGVTAGGLAASSTAPTAGGADLAGNSADLAGNGVAPPTGAEAQNTSGSEPVASPSSGVAPAATDGGPGPFAGGAIGATPATQDSGSPATTGAASTQMADGGAAALPMPSPFAAAVAAAKDRETGTSHVVNDVVNEDLVLARALLGAVLAAVDTPPVGLAWAVSVMRGPSGQRILLTSNEGRGWLPAGLFLPDEVSTPWAIEEPIDAEVTAAWEGVADPARVLAEFALARSRESEAHLSALVSSGPIDASLRAALPDTAIDDLVGPSYDLDLRVPVDGTVDRLALSGFTAPETLVAVPDSAIRARELVLAYRAHTTASRGVSSSHVATVRSMRERILSTLQSGISVPRQLWDDLRDADDLLAAVTLSRRVDVGRVDLGGLRVDTEAEALRALVFERRANEIVLLLAGDPTRQSLRDTVYAHEQIVSHPGAGSVAASTPSVGHGAVVVPVVAGPPGGVSVAGPTVVPTPESS
ncbi:type VII secretion target [Nocardia sp. NBC_00511]|uniref:type VII secretion target n=1 Tax=Nocardia sp. NBC_00511 TaxID=2903591 RepID=UPI002F917A53